MKAAVVGPHRALHERGHHMVEIAQKFELEAKLEALACMGTQYRQKQNAEYACYGIAVRNPFFLRPPCISGTRTGNFNCDIS